MAWRDFPPPLPGRGSFFFQVRWLAPPANFHWPSGPDIRGNSVEWRAAGMGGQLGCVRSWDGCLVWMDAQLGWMRGRDWYAVGMDAQLGWMRGQVGCAVGMDAWLGWMRGRVGCVVGMTA